MELELLRIKISHLKFVIITINAPKAKMFFTIRSQNYLSIHLKVDDVTKKNNNKFEFFAPIELHRSNYHVASEIFRDSDHSYKMKGISGLSQLNCNEGSFSDSPMSFPKVE